MTRHRDNHAAGSQRFSRFSVVGDFRRPQTPALGFTPAQTRAKGQALMDSNSARAGLHAPRRLSKQWKGFEFPLSRLATVGQPPIHAARVRQQGQERRFAGWTTQDSRHQARRVTRAESRTLATARSEIRPATSPANLAYSPVTARFDC